MRLRVVFVLESLVFDSVQVNEAGFLQPCCTVLPCRIGSILRFVCHLEFWDLAHFLLNKSDTPEQKRQHGRARLCWKTTRLQPLSHLPSD